MKGKYAIEVDQVCKTFHVDHAGSGSLKMRLLRRELIPHEEQLEVLRGVSFTVSHGECVAIMGRNGAGKSTLLSIIAKVIRPTSGKVTVDGRVAPLLELGSGFHSDLTGLENIFFNGIMLGLTSKEIQARIDDIVDFSELGTHIDAPIRTYSSGMVGRLGFSIAVHVDAEILIVDEVLSVGDFSFRQKCLHRITEFRESGGTILQVSHLDPTGAADRAIWLHQGSVMMDGDPNDVFERYQEGPADRLAEQGKRLKIEQIDENTVVKTVIETPTPPSATEPPAG